MVAKGERGRRVNGRKEEGERARMEREVEGGIRYWELAEEKEKRRGEDE